VFLLKYKFIKDGGIATPQGFKVGVAKSGIKYQDRYDLAFIVSQSSAVAAGVFTTNKFCAAPVLVSKKHLMECQEFRGFVINSGCANACTGEEGYSDALKMTEEAAKLVGCSSEELLVASTGVIGMQLPMDRIIKGIKVAGSDMSNDKGHLAAQAIMTTDTVSKEVAVEIEIDKKKILLGAMAKGSGMIHPNMATMLGFVTTDVAISKECLQKALVMANKDSFNMLTVDGDTSTNDTLLVIANGQAGNTFIEDENSEDFKNFAKTLKEVCITLTKMIAHDGEGATKFLEVRVINSPSEATAKKAARSIVGSNLVKTAIFGKDANWGRVVCALGYSGAEFEPNLVDIYLGELLVAQKGRGLNFDEDLAMKVLEKDEVVITVDLNLGDYKGTAWGCDLTYDYVSINAEYRS